MRNGYRPGGAPDISRAQELRIDARFAWEERGKILASQGCDLLLAGRISEFQEFEQLIEAHRASKPAWR
jgi:hypothetical protein